MTSIKASAAARPAPSRTPSEVPPSEMMSPRRLVISTAATLVILMVGIAFVGAYFREPLFRMGKFFVETFGGFGVALGFFLPDAFTIPLPNDAFSTLGIAGGMTFMEVVAWGTAGSLVGGSVGFLIGRQLRRTARMKSFVKGRGRNVMAALHRYGAVTVAVAAITPLPYSIFCWAAGAARVSYGVFLGASSLRLVRVAGYLYLIQIGLFQ